MLVDFETLRGISVPKNENFVRIWTADDDDIRDRLNDRCQHLRDKHRT